MTAMRRKKTKMAAEKAPVLFKPPVALKQRGALSSTDRAQLAREFNRRLSALEHEHVMRLMALFQEFKARAQAIRKSHEM